MLEDLTLNCVGVGFMAWVSMCVLSVFFRTFYSLCGVCRFLDRCNWLCMLIIDVSDGSTYW